MHSLLFKRPESPKQIMSEKVKEFDKLDSEGDELGNSLLATDDENFCQPCNLPTRLVDNNLPHSSTCSYGIQALLNNVHRGYVTNGERRPDGQHISNTDDDQDSSPPHESEILRQWKKKKEEELRERKRESQAKLDHILEQATIERESFYKEREAQIEAKKQLNREREAKYHADVQAKQQEQLAKGNLWEAVAALIDLNGDGDSGKTTSGATSKHTLSPKSMAEQLSTPKKQDAKTRHRDYLPKPAKKTTDLSRMREILLKLQQQPLVR